MTMLRSAIETVEPTIVSITVVSAVIREAISDGLFEEARLEPEHVVVDVGADVGHHALPEHRHEIEAAGGGERQHDDDEQQIVENRLMSAPCAPKPWSMMRRKPSGMAWWRRPRAATRRWRRRSALVAHRPAPDHAQIADLLQRCGLGAGGRHERGRSSGGPAWSAAARSATPSRGGAFAALQPLSDRPVNKTGPTPAAAHKALTGGGGPVDLRRL